MSRNNEPHFKTFPKTEWLPKQDSGRQMFRLLEQLEYVTNVVFQTIDGKSGVPVEITVPAGFEFDWASVPRFFWRIVPPVGMHGPAACLHDYLYVENLLDRKTCDRIFLEAMKCLGVKRWKRNLMYRAVRMGGGRHFKKHTQRLMREE